MALSVLTLVKGRRPQLHNLITGLAQSTPLPDELVIAAMDKLTADELPDAPYPIRLVSVPQTGRTLPLAKARNAAAHAASGDTLILLDVDCIPHPEMCAVLAKAVEDTQGVVMGETYYLPDGALDTPWTVYDLHARAEHHPRRPTLAPGEVRREDNYAMLWRLCIALSKATFLKIGGFDEGYTGYGGEDTDFAYRLREAGVPFHLVGAFAYHQYHPVYRPPVKLVEDLAANTRRFRKTWGAWPMGGWLAGLRDMGLIAWEEDGTRLEVLREATPQEIEQAFVADGKGY